MIAEKIENRQEYTATKNACKLCTPLGASLAFKGIENAVPLIHGSQGCSTYIRRYLISHFKEPMDIACSNFGEETAIFGGGANLKIALKNITKQYNPSLIGVATTCLSETIGDDVPMFLREYLETEANNATPVVHVSTPSYKGTHMDGFHGAVRAAVDSLCPVSASVGEKDRDFINIFPGMLSPEDMRHLKEIVTDFDTPFVMLPDYSETLDGALWTEYHKIPGGGTAVRDISRMGEAGVSLEFGKILAEQESAGKLLESRFGVPHIGMGLPIGVHETDKLFQALEGFTGKPMPEKHANERGRLIDAYADGHKYVMGVRAAVYGEEDLVVGMVSFLREIGVIPVLCASGGKSGHLADRIGDVLDRLPVDTLETDDWKPVILDGADFIEIEEAARKLEPDLLIGHSKGYSVARKLDIPIVRIGFPIHDRIGGQRILHIGYRGAQRLFDQIANTILERRQLRSGIGYSYM